MEKIALVDLKDKRSGKKMDSMCKVSIIVPVYKVEQYLERCIKSVLNQTYKDYELILVNDGSPDNCPQMCDKYAKRYENIRVIHKKNGGLSSARLAGFDVARGEYILFVDSDDYINEYMVEKLVVTIENENADLVLCGYNTVCGGQIDAKILPYQTGCIEGRKQIVSDYILPLIGNSATGINIPGFLCIRLLKRSLIQRSYFVSERKYFLEDHVFDLYYGDLIGKIVVVNEPLYYYCVNRESLSNCYRKNKWEMYSNLYQFFLNYMYERQIVDKESRLDNFVLGAIFASVDNAVLAGNYVAYKTELDLVLNDSFAKKTIDNADGKSLSVMQKMILLLLKLHMHRILYYVRKRRIEECYF